MRLKVSLLIPLSIVLGLAAVQSGRSWLDRQMNQRIASLESQKQAQPVVLSTIVVANRPLRFGDEIKPNLLKEIPWPGAALPQGSFAKVPDIFKDEGRRVALATIQSNEPVLTSKITGPDQKANLAALIEPGMKALTVRVDDVVGVAGFVLPGDRVDVLLTRKAGEVEAFADNILQSIKVLAIDQKADDRLNKPSVARAVTLEVSTDQAQRLIVAQKVGTLTLVLRPIGESLTEPSVRVSSSQLAMPPAGAKGPPRDRVAEPVPLTSRSTVNVTVIRNADRKEYAVPVYRR